MLEVKLRGEIRALSSVIVVCDLFGTNYYSSDEIYDLYSNSLRKVTRSIDFSKESLTDALNNEELKLILNELLKDVVDFERKFIGTKGSDSNPCRKVFRMRYNMKHCEILDHITLNLHEISATKLSELCTEEEILFFGKITVCLDFSDIELIKILSTQISITIEAKRHDFLKKEHDQIVNKPRQMRSFFTSATPSPVAVA
jgi:hypothetical protein